MSTIEGFIWYEKYRPHSIDEMTLPPQYRRNFSEYIKSGEVPHLLLFGPPGSGKTTMGFIFMDSIPCVRLVLNASSTDRGIDTMKGKVRQFASSQAMDGKLKIVFLDESDRLTKEAQDALRNTIETYSKTCRFILTCNEIGLITPALQSRCTPYEFSAFPIPQVIQMAGNILKSENIEFEEADVVKIVNHHYPDIRSIINVIQMCGMGGKLDPNAVSRSSVDPNDVIDMIMSGEVGTLRVALTGEASFVSLYRFLFDTFLGSEEITQEEKVSIVGILSEHLYRDSTVANREINFVACCISLMGELKVDNLTF